MPKNPPKNPSPKFHQAAAALASGERPAAICQRLRIDRSTLTRWQKSPEFQAICSELLSEQREEIVLKMRAAGTKAIDILVAAIEDKTTPMRVRVEAARYILDRLGTGDIARFSPYLSAQDLEKMSAAELDRQFGEMSLSELEEIARGGLPPKIQKF